jgi:simple sugar transport system permease protein
MLAAWLHWMLTQTYRVDHIVSGMAINALALGATNYLDKRFTDPNRPEPMPLLPLELFYTLAILVPLLAALYLGRTRGGLRLLAVGNDPEKSRQMGVEPLGVRFAALTLCGVLCGLGGALIVTNAKWFTDGMTAGRGYIALAALIIGGWRPVPAALACLAFGLFEVLQVQLQGVAILGVQVHPTLWAALPYLATIVALAGLLGRSRAPAGLGRP